MNVVVHFETAPPLTNWQTMLTSTSWKIINYTTEALTATNEFGESKYPVRNSTTWILTVRRGSQNGVHLELCVPAFANSGYARKRLFETIDEMATAVDGQCETSQSLTVDVLHRLRKDSETHDHLS